MVEDRGLPEIDRSSATLVKPARIASKAPAESRIPAGKTQSPCNNSSIVIHPVHFGTGTSKTENGPCPLLSWEVRTVQPQVASNPK
jgi:hypothetical protein